MPRTRRLFVHFIVENLIVPRVWRVGRTTIRPAGSLIGRLEGNLPTKLTSSLQFVIDESRDELGQSEWATIEVPIVVLDGQIKESVIDAAREIARDAIAVLRFFQRACVPYTSVEHQTFGLTVDSGSVVEPRWVTDRRGAYAGSGWSMHGDVASWTFTKRNLRAYRDDARFMALDAALVAGGDGDDWQGRFLTALRTMNIATSRQRPATRIMLLATALEALLGDPYVPDRTGKGRGHQLARRAAYLACGWEPGPPGLHRPDGRPACDILTSAKDPRRDRDLYDPNRKIWACSTYGDIRQLYDDRNAALHGAAAGFDVGRASRHEFHLDRVILEALTWVNDRRPASIAELDQEIAGLPAEPAHAHLR